MAERRTAMSRSKGGVKYFPQYLDRAAQMALLADLQARSLPRRRSIRPPCRARATHERAHDQLRAARLGDRQGARLSIPGDPSRDRQGRGRRCRETLLDLWNEVGGYAAPPEACLVNYYAGGAKMGLHQDKDEEDFSAPVLSVSLGDTGIFRVGGRSRKDPTREHSSSSPAMWWCSAARTGSPFTASTASCPARPTCLPKAAASISLCGG